VAVAEFVRAVFEQTDQRPVDVSEAEEAEVEVANRSFLVQGLNSLLKSWTAGTSAAKAYVDK
jgi:hypothetical protein